MIEDVVKALAQGKNHAALSTMMPAGEPSAQIMWVDCDDEHLLINTEVHRQKYRNVQRDPRVAVAIWDADRPGSYAEVRGRVVDTITGPAAREHIDKLCLKYTGRPMPEEAIQSERVILVIAPDRQRSWMSRGASRED